MDWLRRNRKRLAVGSVALATSAAAGYALYKVYAKNVEKLGGGRGGASASGVSEESWQAQDSSQLTSDAEIEEVFQKLRKVAATQGWSTWSPALRRELAALSKVDGITRALKEGGKDLAPSDKLQLWKELKVESFAHCVAIVWGISLLHAYLDVQLMIVARISTLFDRSNPDVKYHQIRSLLEKELERGINLFMEKNLREICAAAAAAASDIMGSLDLKRRITFQEVISTLACISAQTELKIRSNSLSPPTDHFSKHSEGERQLLNFFHANVRKVVEGQDFEFAVSASANAVSGSIIRRSEELFMQRSHSISNGRDRADGGTSGNGEEERAASIQQGVLPVAKVIPVISAASTGIVADCDKVIEYEVSKLPEVIRASADAFSVHVAA